MLDLNLPIDAESPKIASFFEEGASFALTAETGAGKSVGVGAIAALASDRPTLVVQPRVQNTEQLSNRVAKLFNEKVGNTVGIFNSNNKKISNNTKVVYATDGAVIASLPRWEGWNLVLDEIHEWSANTEVLAAMANRFPMVVPMSATMQYSKIAEYFGIKKKVVHVQGRTFSVQELPNQKTIAKNVHFLYQQGIESVLVFLPGKREIQEAKADLEGLQQWDVPIVPFHGESSPEEIESAFKSGPKIVLATNAASTGLTPPVEAAIDTGFVRELSVKAGVPSLETVVAPLSERKQRFGRVGRTCPGYVIDMCPYPDEDRRDYKTPEIQSSPLETTLLKLRSQGIKLEELDLFHKIPEVSISEAKEVLFNLECLTEGEITPLGEKVARSPLSLRAALIVAKAEEMKLDYSKAAAIAAALECDFTHSQNYKWHHLVRCRTSDLIAKAQLLELIRRNDISESFRDIGVIKKKLQGAKNIMKRLKAPVNSEGWTPTEERAALLCIYAAQKDCVYTQSGNKYFGKGSYRILARDSVVKKADRLVGSPINLRKISLLTNVSIIPQ